jgi:hypothetical protein
MTIDTFLRRAVYAALLLAVALVAAAYAGVL